MIRARSIAALPGRRPSNLFFHNKFSALTFFLSYWHENRFVLTTAANARSVDVTMKRAEQGFTLIELMIVVAIIGILASVAIPAYLDYAVRTQVGNGINLASAAKAAVTEYYQDQGQFPTDNLTAGIEAAANIQGKYVSQVAVGAGGAVQVTYGNDVNFQILNAVLTMDAD